MHALPRLSALPAAALALAACTTTGTVTPGQGGAGACELPGAPDGCGASCTADALCAAGLHCEDGACAAVCWDGRPCADADFVCDARGRCVDPTTIPDGGLRDGDVPDGGNCAEISVTLDAVVPNVLFVVDRSGSMLDPFLDTETSRWAVLRGALFDPAGGGDPGGIVTELDGVVRFGMSLYTYRQSLPRSECPVLVEEDVALGNLETLRGRFDASDPPRNGETPTGDSIRAILAGLPTFEDPVLFVLATDGLPDRCEDPDGHDETSRQLSVDAVEEAFEAGVSTYVISLGPIDAKHTQDLARAGLGLPVKPPGERYTQAEIDEAPPFAPNDDAELREALSTIVRGALTCELDVEGRLVVDRACEGTLLVDGVETPCDDPGGGWRAVDEDTIELLGDLCEDLKAGRVDTVEGRFPCEVVLE